MALAAPAGDVPSPIVNMGAPDNLSPVINMTGAEDPTKGTITKNVAEMEDKVSENAKNVVKRLETPTDTTTLADLNSARQTITRIEAMIDLEKHLAELEKLRGERTGLHAVTASLAGAIPASALTPLPKRAPAPAQAGVGTGEVGVEEMAAPMSSGFGHIDITRITGTDGRYSRYA